MIRILVVDDSPTARLVLTRELERQPDFTVVGAAADAFEARQLILSSRPDVLTLDLQMPRMSGLDFLEKLMAHHPLPVVIVSSLTADRSQAALAALRLGAVEVVGKARLGSSPDAAAPLVDAIRAAGQARLRKAYVAATPGHDHAVRRASGEARRASDNPRHDGRRASDGAARRRGPADSRLCGAGMTAPDVIAIGASTGGTRAIEDVLRQLPGDVPGIVIAQHLPASFTRSFAARLNTVCLLAVREAEQGDIVVPGTALIAPGGCDTILVPAGGQLRVHLVRRAPGTGQSPTPSVDRLFHSVAGVCGAASIGILLTGMGTDGAQGLAAMRDSGALTIAESEETCVVFGMPRAAIELGAAAAIAPLTTIPDLLLEVLARTAAAQI